MILTFCPMNAAAGVYSQTAHGNPQTGVLRLTDSPRGSCGQCHVDGSSKASFDYGLWQENDNLLCANCHQGESLSGVFPGEYIYQTSEHAINNLTLWPGPTPAARKGLNDSGKCLNCHSPHGESDRQGLIPELLVQRGEQLCLTCHDGFPSSRDIARDLRKPYNHSATRHRGRHQADEGGDPNRYAYPAGNRHADCNDCHNPHAAYTDSGIAQPPLASKRNQRVSRVRVNNGPAGSIPGYDYLEASVSALPVLEYEICFKCHSSWTQQPPGQQDLARLLNPNNASYHPVETQGKNLAIKPEAFVNNLSAFSQILCSSCHGSDEPDLSGPHGSQIPNLLKAPYDATSFQRSTLRDELCFQCHSFDVYAEPTTPTFLHEASRFNEPASPKGHSFHVGTQRVPCFACHDSHGSPRYGALITTGRSPGILSFNMDPGGGSCTTSCHARANYLLNYAR